MIVRSRIKETSIESVDDIFSDPSVWQRKGQKTFFIIDESVYTLYHEPLEIVLGEAPFMLVPSSEGAKSLQTVERAYDFLLSGGFQRQDRLCVIGGGILHDLGGFVASTLYRGVTWVYIPTTLLAQVDSCLGGKTALNFNQWKNQIGTFYPADRVVIDVSFCRSLSDRDFRSGLGEMIKVHLMDDYNAFDRLQLYLKSPNPKHPELLSKMVWESLHIKKSYVENDEFDRGKRNLLNYGHTFGHALETASQFHISHGEAVILGIAFENLLARQRYLLNEDLCETIERNLRPYFVSYDFRSLSVDEIITHMSHDKKRVGANLSMVLLSDIGRLHKYEDIQRAEIRRVYEDFLIYVYG